jgi:CheY-like chemotaxis protein
MNQILFMSSDPVLRQKNIEVLSQNGFTVSDSADCLGGLLKIDKSDFDTIVIDEELSDYDGYEACQKIRQHSEIPIILIGTRSDSEVWDKVEELGFDIYMSKPISPRELLARIKAIVRRPSPERKQAEAQQVNEGFPRTNTYENKQIIEEPAKPAAELVKPAAEPPPPPETPESPDAEDKKPPGSTTPPEAATEPEISSEAGEKDEYKPAPETSEEPVASEEKAPVSITPSEKEPEPQSTAEKENILELPSQPEIQKEQPESPEPSTEITPPVEEPVSEPVIPTLVTPEREVPQKPTAKTIYCTNCGQPSPVGQRFCGYCGNKLPEINPQPALPEEKTISSEPMTKENPENNSNSNNNRTPDISMAQDVSRIQIEPAQMVQEIPPENSTAQTHISETSSYQDLVQHNGSLQIWEDGRAVKLVEALVNGKITDIIPTIDLSSKTGFSYPQVNNIIDGSDEDTMHTLESLEKANILIKKPYEKLLMDPDGTFQLVPQERCPNCDSANLITGQLVEHFACGYVGMEQDFKVDHKYVCPKCHRDMKLIGTDYRNAGIHYRCLNCNEVFATPVIKWRSLNTHKVWNADELRQVWVYSYSFSPDKKDWLEFQLKPKTQLVDFLKLQGYQVEESAQLPGSSGAVHILDILAVRDDILTKINLGIGILVAMPGESEVQLEELFRYDTRAYDVGINYKVVIAIPKLSPEATKFAERQMIRTFESRTLGALVTHITNQPKSSASIQTQIDDNRAPVPDQTMAYSEPGALLVRFLRNRGYEVFERAKIIGKSGAEHVFSIIARRDDGIVMPAIVIEMSSLAPGQEVDINELSQFDSEAYDAGIRNKVFVGLPRMSTQALQFARQQKISTIEANDLHNFM